MKNMLNIIYEDQYILAVHKPAGLATQTGRLSEPDLYSEICNYLKGGYAAIINRLDQPVEGIVLLARDKSVAAKLEDMLGRGQLSKYYHASVYGHMDEGCKVQLEDYICRNRQTNSSYICDSSVRDSKLARLEYTVLSSDDSESLLDIHLITGRHHQIRVQMANAGHPILGDLKYGNEESIAYSRAGRHSTVSLIAYRLKLTHPVTGIPLDLNI